MVNLAHIFQDNHLSLSNITIATGIRIPEKKHMWARTRLRAETKPFNYIPLDSKQAPTN